MCLWAEKEKIKGAAPSKRRHAWKVVTKARTARVIFRYEKKYRKGSVHKADLTRIHAGRMHGGRYFFGLHVYTTRAKARAVSWLGLKIIKVQVDPKDWVADGYRGDAVYSKLKVLT